MNAAAAHGLQELRVVLQLLAGHTIILTSRNSKSFVLASFCQFALNVDLQNTSRVFASYQVCCSCAKCTSVQVPNVLGVE